MLSLLFSVAAIFNIFVLCLCPLIVIVLIIRRLRQEREPNDNYRSFSVRVPRTDLVPIRIPFTFKLIKEATSSYSALHYTTFSEVPYKAGIYWGVSVKELHFFLRRPWSDIIKAFDDRTFLEGNYQYSDTFTVDDSGAEKEMTASYTKDIPVDLGNPPRPYYPLVIILIQSSDTEENQVALVSIVHIKDSVCTLPTCILAQYLKQSTGKLSCLKQLYLSAGGPIENDTPIPMSVPNTDPHFSNLSEQKSESCIVCQTYPLSRALLPCRHTCLCAKCFTRLDRCPICRGPIESYFCIRDEDYMKKEITIPTERRTDRSFWSWIENWDDRITDFLGFRR